MTQRPTLNTDAPVAPTEMSPFMKLPEELHLQIMECLLDLKGNLVSISRVNWKLNRIANTFIYRSLTLQEEDYRDSVRGSDFLRTFKCAPTRIAELGRNAKHLWLDRTQLDWTMRRLMARLFGRGVFSGLTRLALILRKAGRLHLYVSKTLETLRVNLKVLNLVCFDASQMVKLPELVSNLENLKELGCIGVAASGDILRISGPPAVYLSFIHALEYQLMFNRSTIKPGKSTTCASNVNSAHLSRKQQT
jgi:hypothetical protein